MSRQRLLLGVWCAAVALLSSAGTKAASESSAGELLSFKWVEYGENPENATLQVCFTWDTQFDETNSDTGKASSCPSVPFQLLYQTVSDSLVAVVSNGVPEWDEDEGLCCGKVQMNVNKLDYQKERTYMVNSAEVHATANFRFSIEPGKLYAESLEVVNMTRVGGLTDYKIENCIGDTNTSAHCYLSRSVPQGVVCTMSDDLYTNPSNPSSIRVCDSTFPVSAIDQKTALSEVELLYDDQTITVTQTNTENSVLELWICDDCDEAYTVCEGSTCKVNSSPGNSLYPIYVIELDDDSNAISSTQITVQDVNLRSSWLSPDAVGVRWESFDSSYTVSVDEDSDKDAREVSCTDCEELFINRNTAQQTITIKANSTLTKVVVSAPEERPNDVPGAIQSLSHSVLANTTADLTTTICVETEVLSEPSILALLDDQNRTYSESKFDGEPGEKCATLQLKAPTGVVRVIVTEEFSNSSSSTQSDLFFFLPELQRMTETSARATWENLNHASSYSVFSPSVEDGSQSELQCFSDQTCRYYVTATDEDYVSFTLRENADAVQTTTTTVNQNAIDELIIDEELRTRYDDHLYVCYNPGDESTAADHYELGMEREGELVVSDTDPQMEVDSDEICLITSKAVLLGAYVRLWAVVAELDSSGNVLRSGEQIFEDLYLSADAGVYAYVTGQNTSFYIHSSWKLVDDTDYLTGYTINLRTDSDELVDGPVSVPISDDTYTFSGLGENFYIICVTVNGEDFSSDEICSDVIHAYTPEEPEVIPDVEETQTFSSSDDSVKISWSLSDDELEGVTAFLIQYGESDQQVRSRTHIGKTPLSHANVVQQNLDTKASNDVKFRIVPASQTTVDLPLTAGDWSICISAMKGSQAGDPQCQETTVGDCPPNVPVPENIQYDAESTTLTWEKPSGLPSDAKYLVEAVRSSTAKSITTSAQSLDVSTFFGSGEWVVTVQTVSDGCLSEAVPSSIVINGIEITLEQTGLREMRVAWTESVEGSSGSGQTFYTVSFGDTFVDTVSCSVDCERYYVDEDRPADVPFEVVVKNSDTNVKESVTAHFEDIASVTELRGTYRNGLNTSISWGCVEGATCYNVSLYDSSENLKYHDVPVSCLYVFTDPDLHMSSTDVAKVQACTVKTSTKHPSRCGDPQSIRIEPASEDGDSNTLVIVLSSVVVVLFVGVIAGLLVMFFNSGKKKSQAEQMADVELQDSPAPSAPAEVAEPTQESAAVETPEVPLELEEPFGPPVPPPADSYAMQPRMRSRPPPPRGMDPRRATRYDDRPPRPHRGGGHPPPMATVPNRFKSPSRRPRPQSLSPARPSRRSDFETQRGMRPGDRPPRAHSQMSPNRRGPPPRPAPGRAPRSMSYDRGGRPAYPPPHARHQSTRSPPPRMYSPGRGPNGNPPPPRGRY